MSSLERPAARAAGGPVHEKTGAGEADPEREYAGWEKRVDAMLTLLTGKDILPVEDRYHGVEALDPETYGEAGCYEKWIAAASNLLIDKGVFSAGELAEKMSSIKREPGIENAPAIKGTVE